MRKSIICLVLLGFFALSSASGQTWFTGSFNEALAKAKAEGKPLLIDFFTEVG